MSVNSKMTAIADAIRNLLDISGTMGLDAMASNISSITKRGAVAGTISTKAEQYIIPDGYHNGNGSVGIADAEQAKIIAENIKSGVTILGVAGSASGEIFSIIAVTYPAGSSCTCSNGTITLTARDTSGKALFNVPNIGTWTVNCTDGTRTSSRTVNITDAGQVESVHIYFTVYLYNKGDEFTDVTGGWVQYKNCGGTIIKENDNIALNLVGVAAADRIGYVRTSNKIDLTKYKKLVINSDWVKSKSTTGHDIEFGVYSAPPATWSDFINPVAAISYGSNILDVSSISGEYYILVGAYMNGQTSYYADLSIKEVYME